MSYVCKCCLSTAVPRQLQTREMMYGTREPFTYLVCSDCGSMQIDEVPGDMGKYYREDMYPSWNALPAHIEKRPPPLERFLRSRRTDFVLRGKDLLGRALTRFFGAPELPFDYDWEWFRRLGIGRSSHILDFGCGSGNLLRHLRHNGFERLRGYDKFSTATIDEPDVVISKSLPADGLGRFDLIMLHHSLEHVPDPFAELQGLLPYAAPHGALLVRLPVAHSYAAQEYGADWVQLDPPRHLVIPSERGMLAMASRLGLEVTSILYDSSAFQFIGSEQYRADIPMYDMQRSWMRNKNSPFGPAEKAAFEARAAVLNKEGRGDQASFFLRRRASAD